MILLDAFVYTYSVRSSDFKISGNTDNRFAVWLVSLTRHDLVFSNVGDGRSNIRIGWEVFTFL